MSWDCTARDARRSACEFPKASRDGFASLGWDVEIVPSRDPDAVARACATADLVSVHSPPFQHREHVLAALAAGRAVLCDKPFGRNGADIERSTLWVNAEGADAFRAAGVSLFQTELTADNGYDLTSLKEVLTWRDNG